MIILQKNIERKWLGEKMKSLEATKEILAVTKRLMNEADALYATAPDNPFEYHRGAYDALCWVLEEELKRETMV
jgi:hypothetical protein